jgi:hypothetical protein
MEHIGLLLFCIGFVCVTLDSTIEGLLCIVAAGVAFYFH